MKHDTKLVGIFFYLDDEFISILSLSRATSGATLLSLLLPKLSAPSSVILVTTRHLVTLISHSDSWLLWGQIVHTLINISEYQLRGLEESFFDIEWSFGWGFHEDKVVILCKSLPLFEGHLPSCVKITLIANQHNSHVRIAILSNFLQPSRQMIKCVSPISKWLISFIESELVNSQLMTRIISWLDEYLIT